MTGIAEQLDGRRIAVTGGTGFLGTALIERLLRCVPGCQLVLLIRPGRRSTVQQRAKREIFGNNAFDRLRQELGRDGFDQMVEDRVTAIAGDVGYDSESAFSRAFKKATGVAPGGWRKRAPQTTEIR